MLIDDKFFKLSWRIKNLNPNSIFYLQTFYGWNIFLISSVVVHIWLWLVPILHLYSIFLKNTICDLIILQLQSKTSSSFEEFECYNFNAIIQFHHHQDLKYINTKMLWKICIIWLLSRYLQLNIFKKFHKHFLLP